MSKEDDDNEEECEAFFSVGHEYTPPDMKTKGENAGERRAWFSDIPDEQHESRIVEEREFLVKDAQSPKKVMKMPNKSFFDYPSRTIPVGVGPLYSLAIEFSHQQDVDDLKLKENLTEEELSQLVHYFKERLARATTIQQVRNVGGELNTRVKVEKNIAIQKHLLDDVLPLITERLKNEDGTLKDDPDGEEKDMRGEPVACPAEQLPTHSISRMLLSDHALASVSRGFPLKKKNKKNKKKKKNTKRKNHKNKKDESVKEDKKTAFRVMVCPTPLLSSSKSASNKRCVWEPFYGKEASGMLFCDKGTMPVARVHEGFFLLCYRFNGVLKVQVTSLEKRDNVYSYGIEVPDSLVDCYFDFISHKIVLAFHYYVLLINCDVRVRSIDDNKNDKDITLADTDSTDMTFISIRYKDDPQLKEQEEKEKEQDKLPPAVMSTISCVYLGYGDLIIGTTRGGCLSFRVDEVSTQPEKAKATFQVTSSTCPLRSIHRTGGNLYATNIMWTVNLQTPDVNSYARGMEISTTGSIFYQDRIIGIDSCGALLASLDKNGILQVQTNRLCLDPDDFTKVLSSMIYSLPPQPPNDNGDETKPMEALHISYPAVFLARRRLICMYPTGQVQCFWVVI